MLPDFEPDRLHQRALALFTAGQRNDALVLLFDALGRATPADAASVAAAPLRALLASLLEPVLLHGADDTILRVLLLLADDPTVPVQQLALPLCGLLVGAPAAAAVLDETDPARAREAVRALVGHPLVQRVLPRIIVTARDAERLCTQMRRLMLHTALRDPVEPWVWDAIACLGAAAGNGEYAWPVRDDEQEQVDRDIAAVNAALGPAAGDEAVDHAAMSNPPIGDAPMGNALLRVAMYGRLSGAITAWPRLATLDTAPLAHRVHLDTLLRLHVLDRLDEQQRAAAVPSLALTDDDGSVRVRAQYESHPYPRWITPPPARVTSIPAFCRERRAHLPPPTSRQILVAGCGTGRQVAHMATSFPDADITALDLSLASLGYASRMLDHLGVRRVQLRHGDLLALEALTDRFALITCSGVLHHLVDPRAGWRQLIHRLDPRGVMKIGLYSTSARAAVRAARDVIATPTLPETDDALRRARQQLMSLDATNPAYVVTESVDFHSLSGFRDLVAHVQERSYTIPELVEELTALDLAFLGFQLPRDVQTQFRTDFPRANPARDLDAWHRFEQRYPLTFGGMYQFWCAPR